MYVSMCVWMDGCMRMYVCMYVSMYVYLYVCMDGLMRMYVCMPFRHNFVL